MKVFFKSENLIGDALNISPALRTWIKQQKHPVDVWMQTLPDHVAPLYEGMVRDLWNPGTLIHTFGTVYHRPEEITFDFEHTFNVNEAFIVSDKDKCHIADSYAKLLGVKLEGGNERLKPIYIPEDDDSSDSEQDTGQYKGCILVSMFSASCTSRDPKCNFIPNKQLPFDKWKPLLQILRTEYPETPIRFLGAPEHMEDVNKNNLYAKGIIQPGECMFGIPLNRLALIMQKAKLLVTIDNGMAHLGASQETPTFEMYPRCLGTHYIVPFGNPNLYYVQMDPVYINPAQLCFSLRKAIEKFKEKV